MYLNPRLATCRTWSGHSYFLYRFCTPTCWTDTHQSPFATSAFGLLFTLRLILASLSGISFGCWYDRSYSSGCSWILNFFIVCHVRCLARLRLSFSLQIMSIFFIYHSAGFWIILSRIKTATTFLIFCCKAICSIFWMFRFTSLACWSMLRNLKTVFARSPTAT